MACFPLISGMIHDLGLDGYKTFIGNKLLKSSVHVVTKFNVSACFISYSVVHRYCCNGTVNMHTVLEFWWNCPHCWLPCVRHLVLTKASGWCSVSLPLPTITWDPFLRTVSVIIHIYFVTALISWMYCNCLHVHVVLWFHLSVHCYCWILFSTVCWSLVQLCRNIIATFLMLRLFITLMIHLPMIWI